MLPTEELVNEHNAIKRMLSILESVATRLDAGMAVDENDMEQMVEFIQGFADRCHHGKEEDLLFGAMVRAGIPRETGPIAVMLYEHTVGREFVKKMSAAITACKAGETGAAAEFAENARGYVALLSQHIQKEDRILYPMANQVLSAATQSELLEGFERIERERVGPGKHEAYHALLDRFAETYRREEP